MCGLFLLVASVCFWSFLQRNTLSVLFSFLVPHGGCPPPFFSIFTHRSLNHFLKFSFVGKPQFTHRLSLMVCICSFVKFSTGSYPLSVYPSSVDITFDIVITIIKIVCGCSNHVEYVKDLIIMVFIKVITNTTICLSFNVFFVCFLTLLSFNGNEPLSKRSINILSDNPSLFGSCVLYL